MMWPQVIDLKHKEKGPAPDQSSNFKNLNTQNVTSYRKKIH